jgi:hypothetical protein
MKKKLKKYQGKDSGSQVSKTSSDTTKTSVSSVAARYAKDPKVQALIKKMNDTIKYTPPEPKLMEPNYGKPKIKKTGGAIKSKKKK